MTDLQMALLLAGLAIVGALVSFFRQATALREAANDLAVGNEQAVLALQVQMREERAAAASVLAQVLLLKGVHPHHAAPSTFTPSGASWQVHDELAKVMTENAVPQAASAEQAEIERDRMEAYELAGEWLKREPEAPTVHSTRVTRTPDEDA